MLILTCVSLQISSKLMADEDVFIYLEEVSHSKKEICYLDSTKHNVLIALDFWNLESTLILIQNIELKINLLR